MKSPVDVERNVRRPMRFHGTLTTLRSMNKNIQLCIKFFNALASLSQARFVDSDEQN